MSILHKKTNSEIYHEQLEQIRKFIPSKYNQVKMLDYLDDPDIDLGFSITTRTDGKTFNYLMALAMLSESLDFCTCVIVPHWQLRNAMMDQIEEIYRKIDHFNIKLLTFNLQNEFIEVVYKDKIPFYITDLNNASDLKNYRAVLNRCNLTFFDEFLRAGGDYEENEFKKWKTIFETIDGSPIPPEKYTNNLRKALFMANPVDFNSEFLAHYNMYKYLETQPMNTVQKHGNYVLERFKNTNAQEGKNNRLFNEKDNESITGEFKVNSWNIRDPKLTTAPTVVKLAEKYLYIYEEDVTILGVKPSAESYQFNTELADNTKDSIYLNDNYYRMTFSKKYEKGEFYFANQYSKDFILTDYPTLNINKILRKISKPDTLTEEIKKYEYSEAELLKKRLILQYL